MGRGIHELELFDSADSDSLQLQNGVGYVHPQYLWEMVFRELFKRVFYIEPKTLAF